MIDGVADSNGVWEKLDSMKRALDLANAATKVEVLPDSRLTTVATPKGSKFWRGHGWWVPFYCASCAVECGSCAEENMTFMFYLCPKCFESYGEIAGTYAMPDELFFARVAEAQLTHYGRPLSFVEMMEALANPESPMSRLARDRTALAG